MSIIELTPEAAKVFIETFGCTANVGDEMKMRAMLKSAGHELGEAREADVIIVNTCTVTKRTELNVIKRLKAWKAAGKKVIVAGCMAAAQPELVKSILGDDVAMTTPGDLRDREGERVALDFEGVIAVIPIAMGCVGTCSYCFVKRARGDLRSCEPEKIRRAVKSAVERGAREIRITAQDCSAYGWDCPGIKLPELLEMITAIEGDFRIRVGMMNPSTVIHHLDELFDAFDSAKLFKFFHVPVQSGSDRVLGDMKRNYKAADFLEIVKSIRARFDYSTLCTDFIPGFPTETDADFFASLKLLEEVKPEKVNITRFSPRPGTEASTWKDVLEREKKRRSRMLSAVYHRTAFAKNKAWVGRNVPVFVTERGKKGGMIARDTSYRAIVVNRDVPPGAACTVRIVEARSTYFVGDVVVDEQKNKKRVI